MKPFAIISLRTLKTVCFDSKDELQVAVATYQRQQHPCIVLKYHAAAGCYAEMEVAR